MIIVNDDEQQWLEQLSGQKRERGEEMLQNLRAMGCEDPLGWARSEKPRRRPRRMNRLPATTPRGRYRNLGHGNHHLGTEKVSIRWD